MIIERTKVLAAYNRARELGADHDKACAAVAQALGVTVEIVNDVAWQAEEVAP
jgi:hypothetical protein